MANAVAVDGSGDVLVTGQFTGSVDFGTGRLTTAGGNDVFVARYSAAGAPLWARRFGGLITDVGSGVAVDGSGNVLVTGYFAGTVDFGPGPDQRQQLRRLRPRHRRRAPLGPALGTPRGGPSPPPLRWTAPATSSSRILRRFGRLRTGLLRAPAAGHLPRPVLARRQPLGPALRGLGH
jgi:hypothetical protein